VGRLLSLATGVFLGRVLGTAGFGQYGILNTTVGALGPVSALQTGLTSTKYVAEYREVDPSRAAAIITMTTRVAAMSGGLTTLSLVVLTPFLSSRWLSAPTLMEPLAVSALVLLFSSLTSSQAGVLTGFEAFRELAWIEGISGVLSLFLVAAGGYYDGIRGVAAAWTVSQCLRWLLTQTMVGRVCRRMGIPAGRTPERRDYSLLWSFSVPSMVASMISGPAFWFASVLLVNQEHGYEEMGVFAAANQWRAPILFVSSAMAAVIVPVLSNINSRLDRNEFRRALRLNVVLIGGVAAACAIVTGLLAPSILSLYGRRFTVGTVSFVALQMSTVLSAIGEVFGNAVVSRGRMRLVVLIHVVTALAVVLGALSLVPRYKAVGLALTVTLQASAFLAASWTALLLTEDGGG
jgi:O-antigen/teichoic acid export membrane protein